jgi:hypothetical protein
LSGFSQHLEAIDLRGKSPKIGALIGGLILVCIFLYQRLP